MSSLEFDVSCADVHRLLAAGEGLVLVDCRQQSEWDVARIDGATLIPLDQLQARVGELEPHRDQRIVVHCHHGGRSARVVQWLRQIGFAHAQNMAGGIDAWSQEVDPQVPRY
ncbi:MAG: rhodanese-like domain-containing protein [Planctomycetales bacterium]|nr:rhodanese-like domain-containing protein [Planctomycetales bacterium]